MAKIDFQFKMSKMIEYSSSMLFQVEIRNYENDNSEPIYFGKI